MRNRFPTALLLINLFLCSWFGTLGCASSRPASVTGATAPGRAHPPIVLVCSFDVLTTNEECVHPALAIGPLLRRDLFCMQEISVIPTQDTHTAAKPFFYKTAALERLASLNGADIVTVGWVSRKAKKITIEFRAFDFANDKPILETKVEGDISQIFKLERVLVFRLVDAMGIKLSKIERQRLAHCRPTHHEAAIEFGRGLQKEEQGEYGESFAAFQRAAEADDCFGLPYAAEAGIQLRNKEIEAAGASYEEAVERDPFFAEAWYEMNLRAAQYLKDDKLAIEYCEKALEIAPLFGKARLSLGARLHATGDTERAIEETKRAAELMPDNPLPLHNLGICYRDSGQPAEARKWFERALAVDPGFIYASAELQKLKAR